MYRLIHLIFFFLYWMIALQWIFRGGLLHSGVWISDGWIIICCWIAFQMGCTSRQGYFEGSRCGEGFWQFSPQVWSFIKQSPWRSSEPGKESDDGFIPLLIGWSPPTTALQKPEMWQLLVGDCPGLKYLPKAFPRPLCGFLLLSHSLLLSICPGYFTPWRPAFGFCVLVSWPDSFHPTLPTLFLITSSLTGLQEAPEAQRLYSQLCGIRPGECSSSWFDAGIVHLPSRK